MKLDINMNMNIKNELVNLLYGVWIICKWTVPMVAFSVFILWSMISCLPLFYLFISLILLACAWATGKAIRESLK